MRLPNSPMTATEFDEAIAAAIGGEILSDTGASDELEAALIAIAQADPAYRERLIFTARQIRERELAH